MKFSKMHGAGNDFIIINNIEEQLPLDKLGALAADLCRRRLSVGADGMMVIRKAKKDGDFGMIFFNSDGSEGEMCGNGARCICRYGYEHGLAGEIQRVETISGTVVGTRISEDQYRVRLNDISCLKLDMPIEFEGKNAAMLSEEFGKITASYAEMGTPGLPHAVVIMNDFDEHERRKLAVLGDYLRYYKEFTKGANINFCRITAEDEVKLLTYERGVEDFTLACGTGCGTTAAVLTKKSLVSGKETVLHNEGGTIKVTFTDPCKPETDIFITGPAALVCEGEIK